MTTRTIVGYDDVLWPEWYTPSNERDAHNWRVAHGLHPFGEVMSDNPDARCGNCALLAKVWRFWKCSRFNQAASGATDVQKSWRGCRWWEKAGDEDTAR